MFRVQEERTNDEMCAMQHQDVRDCQRNIALYCCCHIPISIAALQSPDILLSYSTTTLALHITTQHNNNNPYITSF